MVPLTSFTIKSKLSVKLYKTFKVITVEFL